MKGLKEFFKQDKFAELVGAELVEVKEGYARARMLVDSRHLNGAGTCQGGAIFTLADLAFAAAVNSHRVLTVSICSNITFVKSAREGWIYAEARELVNHHKVPFAEVKVTDEEGNILAIFTSNGYRKNVTI